MVEFTKEELHEMFEAVMFKHGVTNDLLLTKIQSLIDNYCDHDLVHTYTEREIERCSRCDKESL